MRIAQLYKLGTRSCDHVIHTLYFKASTLQAKKNKKYILILGVKASTFQAPKKQSPVRVPRPPFQTIYSQGGLNCQDCFWLIPVDRQILKPNEK